MTAKKDLTHCIRGHELSGDNVYMRTDKQGKVHRVCKKCRMIRKNDPLAMLRGLGLIPK